jgi:hypothetical protein
MFGPIMFLAMLYNRLSKEKVEPIKVVKVKEEFDVEKFNEWFKTEYTGYGGSKGAPGIFLRTDKLSPSMIQDYLLHIGYQDIEAHEFSYKFWETVRQNWIKQLHERN